MSTILERPSVRNAAMPITVAQYHRLSEAGIISERTELLQGVIVDKMTKSPRHSYLVHLLVKWLEASAAPGYYVRMEQPLTLERSEPEPDVAIVRGAPEDYRTRHPETAELVIEVAVATLELDRDKADVYAAAGVPEYWIVVPDAQAVEVFRDPSPTGYQWRQWCVGADVELRPSALPHATIRLANLFA